MAVVRLEALRQLAQLIGDEVPEFEGRICLGQADASKAQAFPSLAIDPRRWSYAPDQALEVFEPSPNQVVMNIGRHEADVNLHLGAATPFERYELEAKILDVFLSTPLHPGVVITQVVACEKLGEFTASWELDSDEWADERAFSQEFYSDISITGIIPALVTRRDAYTIDQLQLGLECTQTPTDGNPPAFADPPVEIVQVNQDGTVSAVP